MTPLALQLAVEDDRVSPGLLGFCVVAVLAVATWLLLKSMNKQMKRVNFEERPETPAAPSSDDAADGRPEGADTAADADGDREHQDNGAK
ncbi:hypothetical protein [Yinghuangia seranimata]|uniref:hypothetical protein n=1 Tax=Yinghuangia seranimata TaxID=408067 RepID=UPI00248C90D9|nr:hypothetical protein [Yinghuangia seranimata]MDI2128835.1 hypothetical protein [Yinghuangia seranimata]